MLNPSDESNLERMPRPARKLSNFIAQELLYDYMRGALSADRQTAMKESLQSSPDLQYELRSMSDAEKYAQELSKTKISPIYLEELSQIRPGTEVFLDKLRWKNWPDFMRWATEALLISIVVAVAAMFVPWASFNFEFPKSTSNVMLAEIKEAPSGQDASPTPSVTVPPEDSTSTTPVAVSASAPVTASVAATAPEPTPVSARTEPMEDEAVTEPESELKAAQTIASGTSTAEAKKVATPKGLLYRVMMSIESDDEITQSIRDKIVELGGEKAGQVELGWKKKNPDGSYYHFTLPENNYQELITTLGVYGPVRIYKNPHDRVMPEGQIRIILWVEEKSQDEQGQ